MKTNEASSYLFVLEITTENSLKLNFYEDCIDNDLSVCTQKTKGNENYLRYFSQSENQECQNFEQVAQSMNDVLQFCVDMGNSSWAETTYQYWPLNKFDLTDKPFVTRNVESQAVVESLFLQL
eukprot:XP_016657921.1 PREDICTED: uncharacterized protein LOC103308657 [Acyrthosiphon pisum]